MRKILIALVLLASFCFADLGDSCKGYETEMNEMQEMLMRWIPLKGHKDYKSRGEEMREVWKIEKANMGHLKEALKAGDVSPIINLHREIKLEEYYANPVNMLILANILVGDVFKKQKNTPAGDEFMEMFSAAIDVFMTKYELGVTGKCALETLLMNVVILREMQEDGRLFLKPFP